MSDFVTRSECKGVHRSSKLLLGLFSTFAGLVMLSVTWACYAGYSAKSGLETHSQVQTEHDKHIKEDLDDIKSMLRSLGAKAP